MHTLIEKHPGKRDNPIGRLGRICTFWHETSNFTSGFVAFATFIGSACVLFFLYESKSTTAI